MTPSFHLRGEVWVHKTSLTLLLFYRSVCSKPGKWSFMYICARGIDLTDSTIFLLFQQCGIFLQRSIDIFYKWLSHILTEVNNNGYVFSVTTFLSPVAVLGVPARLNPPVACVDATGLAVAIGVTPKLNPPVAGVVPAGLAVGVTPKLNPPAAAGVDVCWATGVDVVKGVVLKLKPPTNTKGVVLKLKHPTNTKEVVLKLKPLDVTHGIGDTALIHFKQDMIII